MALYSLPGNTRRETDIHTRRAAAAAAQLDLMEKTRQKLFQKIVKLTDQKGRSLSEALLFAERGENMLCTKIVLNVRYNFCKHHVVSRFELGIFMYCTCNLMNNLSSYCGLVDAKNKSF